MMISCLLWITSKKLKHFFFQKLEIVVKLVEFFKDDFDHERLILHRNMMLNFWESKIIIVESTEDLVSFLSSNKHEGKLIRENDTHGYKQEAKKLNLENMMNIFIKRTTVRKNTFFYEGELKIPQRQIFQLVFCLRSRKSK